MHKIFQVLHSEEYRRELRRKSIHLSSLWMPALIYFAPKAVSVLLFAVILAGDIILEYGNYKKWKWATKLFGIFSSTLRKKETQHDHFVPTGSVYVLSAALLCSLFFSKPVAAIALSVMLIADIFAALIGKLFGKHKIYREKSMEGSGAFFISALLVMLLLSPIYQFSWACVVACVVATLAELFESALKIDDNLSIPAVIGIILSVF